MADAIKVGAYVCKGCGLGGRLNADQLELTATYEGRVQLCRQHDFLCSAEGIATIRKDIDDLAVNRVVIAACSPRAKTEAFHFDGVPISRANLREGVIWVRPDRDDARETTQEMADDYVRMACAEVKAMKVAAPSGEQQRNTRLLIVGGGVTGMTAALEAAKAGYPCTIVEKSGALGGAAARLWKRVPDRAPYNEPQDNGVAAMVSAIDADPDITVHLNSTVTRTSGAPGRFAADITAESGSTITGNFGAILQTSGFSEYDANRLPELGYGRSRDVVTQMELEALAAIADGGSIKRPSDGKEVRSVVFVQCAGQRSDQHGHLPYCSGHCCLTSIKQAMYFRDQNPDIDTTILFDDLRTPGAGGENFYRAGQQKGVTFVRGKVSGVVSNASAQTVRMRDLVLDANTEIEADLVVLATGMVPNSGPNPYADQEIAQAGADGNAARAGELKRQVEVAPPSILNLQYQQGTDLPQLVHGFADSHFVCFPYETRRTGIYTAGPVRRPMDIRQAREDAAGAALKAIQAVENAALGRAAAPRSGDLSFPTFRKDGCTRCMRCSAECPFRAINEDAQGYPQYNESRCRRCGTCMGACPVHVVSFDNYSVEMVSAQIKNVDIPDELDQKPRILVLACENDAYPALDMAGLNRIEYSGFARIIPVRCLGSINLIWIADALNSGYDGVVLMGCPQGDDYQCHFVRGSATAHERQGKIANTLQSLSLEAERVAVYEVAITDIERAPRLIDDMAETVQRIGMSPFKF